MINTIVGLLLGSTAYYLVLLYTGLVAVMFMANTLQNAIPEHSTFAASKRNYLLIGSARCLHIRVCYVIRLHPTRTALLTRYGPFFTTDEAVVHTKV